MKAGWKTVKLGDVTKEFIVPQRDKPKNLCGDIPWCRIEDIDGIYLSGSKSGKGVTAKDVKEMPLRIFPAGTVIVSCSADLGRCAIVSKPLITNQTFLGIVPDETIYAKYLYYLLRSRAEQLNSMATGATIKYLSRDKFSSLEIPLPPLAEQKRIVALLDEAFAGIDEAKAKTEEILERTQALFESHLQSIFTQRGLDWVERRLGKLSRINYGYTESASSEKIGPHFLRITDIQDDGVDWNTVPYCPIDKADFPKYKLTDGDIVFARTGATTGKSYLVSNPPDSVFASYLIRVQLSDKALIPGFLYLFFQTRSYWDVIHAGVSGSAQGGFNASKLGELTIPYPASLNDQKAVIHSIREIQADTLKVGKLSNQKLEALSELRESLLTQAFAGELTA